MLKFDNANMTEVAKFSGMAEDWWDLNGVAGGLHAMNPVRMGFINSQLTPVNRKVLDVGCGGGILKEALAKAGARVVGIDLSETLLSVAKQHAEKEKLNIDYRLMSVEKVCEEHHGEFDCVVCMEMLEHVPNPSKLVKDCAHLVKQDGHVFFSTINRNWLSYIFAIIGAEYILRLLPKGTHNYSQFIRPSELQKWGRENNLTLVEISGITYHPLSKTFSLCKSTHINYIAHFIRTSS